MKFFRLVAYVFLTVLLFAACSKRRGEVTLRIVATTDVHGQIFDRDCLDGTEREGSLAKFSTFLKKQRKEYRNLIYLDAGDILQGSVELYQDITAQYYRTRLASEAYNLLGCDAMACGNHDLAVGIPRFEEFYDYCSFPILGANVCFNRYGDYLSVYRILEYRGVRVGVIGLSTPVVKYSIPADRIGELEFKDIVETARNVVPILREEEKADVVVGLIHSGFDNGRMDNEGVFENDVKRLVSEVSGFDLIIFGHDHTPRCIKIPDCNGDSVLLLNPGPFVRNAAVATVSVDFRNSDAPQISTAGYLQDVSSEVPDNGFMKKLSEWYSDVNNYADSVIGSVSVPFDGAGVLWRESSTMDYIHSIQLNYCGAEISLTSPVFTKTFIPAGDIKLRDLFAAYRFDNTMVSVMLKGSEIKDILEYSAGLYYNTVNNKNDNLLKIKTTEDGKKVLENRLGRFVSAAGIDYVTDVSKPEGKRVTILSMTDGKPFDPDRMYRTTINSFLYGGNESAVFKGAGLSHKDIIKRLVLSSSADIRFYMITDFALAREKNRQINVNVLSNWRLVPEEIVSGCLARDTIQLSIKE